MPKTHQGATNAAHPVKLTSAIEHARWTRGTAGAGGKAGLEVITRFVGNGAEIQIALSDSSGGSYGTFKDKLSGNHFWADIEVPVKARGALIADVSLPKHGLSQTSNALLLMPPVRVTNPKWSAQEARRGDVLTLTAQVDGAPNGAEGEILIFEYDSDGAHDPVTRFPAYVQQKKIEATWEFEYHDDVDDIPTAEESEKGYHLPQYFFIVDVGGVKVKSELLDFRDWIEFRFSDVFGHPVSKATYELRLADGSQRKGSVDDDGQGREEKIPPGPVELVFPDEQNPVDLQN